MFSPKSMLSSSVDIPGAGELANPRLSQLVGVFIRYPKPLENCFNSVT